MRILLGVMFSSPAVIGSETQSHIHFSENNIPKVKQPHHSSE